MTTSIDQPSVQGCGPTEVGAAGELPQLTPEAAQLMPEAAQLTPEAAQRLAAALAPHLIAMRAVTAGTQYADSADAEPAGQVSPATKIFIAGMLQLLPVSATP